MRISKKLVVTVVCFSGGSGVVFALMDTSTSVTVLATLVAPDQRRVEAKARDQDAEEAQPDPTDAKMTIDVAAAARVDVLILSVGQAVVVDALGARQTRHRLDAVPQAVRRVLTVAPAVGRRHERLPAMSANI